MSNLVDGLYLLLCRSNFQFIWPWEEWAYVLDLPKWAPQRVFVQEVLEREVRLSYWDKVKQVIIHGRTIVEITFFAHGLKMWHYYTAMPLSNLSYSYG